MTSPSFHSVESIKLIGQTLDFGHYANFPSKFNEILMSYLCILSKQFVLGSSEMWPLQESTNIIHPSKATQCCFCEMQQALRVPYIGEFTLVGIFYMNTFDAVCKKAASKYSHLIKMVMDSSIHTPYAQ